MQQAAHVQQTHDRMPLTTPSCMANHSEHSAQQRVCCPRAGRGLPVGCGANGLRSNTLPADVLLSNTLPTHVLLSNALPTHVLLSNTLAADVLLSNTLPAHVVLTTH